MKKKTTTTFFAVKRDQRGSSFSCIAPTAYAVSLDLHCHWNQWRAHLAEAAVHALTRNHTP